MDKVPIYRNKFAYPYEDDKIVYIEPKYKIQINIFDSIYKNVLFTCLKELQL